MANAAQIKARIDEVAKELSKGTQRIAIIRKFEKKWGCSDKSIDRYIKEALPKAEKLAEIKQKTIERVIVSETEEAVKNGLKSDFEIEMQLQKIAFGEMEVLETIETPNGISTKLRNPTPAEMKAAAELILRKRGSLAAEKKELLITKLGKDLEDEQYKD
jgi:flavin-binding protein dodecin